MLPQLQELHVENQQLSSGEKMLFDNRSLQAIAVSKIVFHCFSGKQDSVCASLNLNSLAQCWPGMD